MIRLLKYVLITFLTFSATLINISCEKEKSNHKPTISFLEPANNLVIENDTVLPIILDPFDQDGEIKKVELFINETLVKTFDTPPYQYDWHDAKIDNAGIFFIKAIAQDNEEATGEAEITIEIYDFRVTYLGDFEFTTITENWRIDWLTSIYDTTYYHGVIRKYELIDSENDLYSDDDSEENPNEKITIEFLNDRHITSLINENGNLIPKSGYHYHHQGGFSHIDTISFSVSELGGLGGGWNYEVIGSRE